MKSKHATARLALMLALGCLLGVGLMFGSAACQPRGGGGVAPAACTTNDDCPDGQVCQDGACVAGCEADADCDDGEYCNGAETCNTETGECVDGTSPCTAVQECNEDTDACEAMACEANADCDDGQYCNGVETCVDNVCQAGTSPCEEGQDCDEETDTCVAGVVESPYAEAVAFDHDSHTTAEGLVCTDCHHAEPVNAAGSSCDEEGCHADEWLGGVPKLKEAQHWTCRSCHDERAGEAVRCDTCHTALKDL